MEDLELELDEQDPIDRLFGESTDLDLVSRFDLSADRTDPLLSDQVPPQLKNREWRLEHLYKIENKNGEVVTFKMNPAQRHLFRNLHHRNVVLKARQLGVSTFVLILFLDECLFRSNRKAAIVADKLDNAQKLFRKIAFAWDNIDEEVKTYLDLTLKSDSKTFMEFSNGSSLQVSLTLHSGTYQLVQLSEYGPLCAKFPEKAEEVKKSGLPTVPTDGLVIIESTAEGEGNDFHDIVLNAKRLEQLGLPLSELDYKFFFFPWYFDEGYTLPLPYENALEDISSAIETYLEGLDDILTNLGREPLPPERKYWYAKKAQELRKHDLMKEQFPSTAEEAFISSGSNLFNTETLNAKIKMETRKPIEVVQEVTVFAHFKPGHRYGIGADVGAGIGQHSSTAVVIDFTAEEVVATYRDDRIPPDIFAHKLAYIGRLYGMAIIAPENNNIGHTTVTVLRDIYPNIYTTVLTGYVEDKQTTRLGWSTNAGTKPRMMFELSQAFEEGLLKVPDPQILEEAKMFKKEDSMILDKKQLTRHADLLIGCAIAWQMRSNANSFLPDESTIERVTVRREAQRRGVNNYN